MYVRVYCNFLPILHYICNHEKRLLPSCWETSSVIPPRPSTPYTEAVLHEVLRFGNIFPLSVAHRATADGFLGGGRYFIPGGTDIHCNLGAVLRDPKHFPQPEVFDPTRWGKQSVHSATGKLLQPQ